MSQKSKLSVRHKKCRTKIWFLTKPQCEFCSLWEFTKLTFRVSESLWELAKNLQCTCGVLKRFAILSKSTVWVLSVCKIYEWVTYQFSHLKKKIEWGFQETHTLRKFMFWIDEIYNSDFSLALSLHIYNLIFLRVYLRLNRRMKHPAFFFQNFSESVFFTSLLPKLSCTIHTNAVNPNWYGDGNIQRRLEEYEAFVSLDALGISIQIGM